MLIGYARVSTLEQNLDLQVQALQKAGCDKMYEDKISGLKSHKPGLEQALEHLREGDTFVVWKLDRLGRNVKNLIEFITKLEKKNVNFKSLTDHIDTTSTMGNFFFHVMASLAEMERKLIIERTRAGLVAARQRGRIGGRKRIMTSSKINVAKKLLADGVPAREVADNLGVSVPTLYRWVPASGSTFDINQETFPPRP